jgi:hypothetical protein
MLLHNQRLHACALYIERNQLVTFVTTKWREPWQRDVFQQLPRVSLIEFAIFSRLVTLPEIGPFKTLRRLARSVLLERFRRVLIYESLGGRLTINSIRAHVLDGRLPMASCAITWFRLID